MNPEQFATTSIDITTESAEGAVHDVYFNRGVSASQQYVSKFGDRSPDEVEEDKAYTWLSRGIYEALENYINSCKPGRHALRIAAYEFNYPPLLELLKQTIDKGVDISIIYDARQSSGPKKNREQVAAAGLTDYCIERTQGKSYISHNKFIVKLDQEEPVAVWTGGMNFSTGGIFGHSNVAHVVNDPSVAAKYMEYWALLAEDPDMKATKKSVEEITPLPENPLPSGITCIFSRRKNLEALEAYKEMAMQATDGFFMTFAFGVNKLFKDVYRESTSILRFALLAKKTRTYKKTEEEAKKLDEQEIQDLRNMPENIFSVDSFIKINQFDNWLVEKLSGLNKNVMYIHNKFMLIDTLGPDPIIMVRSANFSDNSTTNNDENMILIRGDKRVADQPGYLKSGNWWAKYYEDTDNATRRKYFSK